MFAKSKNSLFMLVFVVTTATIFASELQVPLSLNIRLIPFSWSAKPNTFVFNESMESVSLKVIGNSDDNKKKTPGILQSGYLTPELSVGNYRLKTKIKASSDCILIIVVSLAEKPYTSVYQKKWNLEKDAEQDVVLDFNIPANIAGKKIRIIDVHAGLCDDGTTIQIWRPQLFPVESK